MMRKRNETRYWNPEEAHRTAQMWARVAMGILALIFLVLIFLFVDRYFGEGGVRFSAVALAIIVLFLIVYFLFAAAMRIVSAVQDNTIQGIVGFQAADDRGEVARAKVIQEMIRGENRKALEEEKTRQAQIRDMQKWAIELARAREEALTVSEDESSFWDEQESEREWEEIE